MPVISGTVKALPVSNPFFIHVNPTDPLYSMSNFILKVAPPSLVTSRVPCNWHSVKIFTRRRLSVFDSLISNPDGVQRRHRAPAD